MKPVCGEYFHVCSKVRIADLLAVVNHNQNYGYFNKISAKHVDFVRCDPTTMQPKLAIELDDSSHQRKDRQERDAFADNAFSAANLPILHVICRSSYQADELQQQIREALGLTGPA